MCERFPAQRHAGLRELGERTSMRRSRRFQCVAQACFLKAMLSEGCAPYLGVERAVRAARQHGGALRGVLRKPGLGRLNLATRGLHDALRMRERDLASLHPQASYARDQAPLLGFL